jgi:hypothetical protein
MVFDFFHLCPPYTPEGLPLIATDAAASSAVSVGRIVFNAADMRYVAQAKTRLNSEVSSWL